MSRPFRTTLTSIGIALLTALVVLAAIVFESAGATPAGIG